MDERNNNERQENKSTPAPDKETLNTTDPQENMKGPVSTTIKETGHAFETNESKKEADIRRH